MLARPAVDELDAVRSLAQFRFPNFCPSRLAHDGTRDDACFIHTDKEHII